MSRDLSLKDETGREYSYNTLTTSGYLLGISTGWKEASNWLLKQAGEAFTNGNDKLAQSLRSLAKDAEKLHEQAYERYNEDERETDYDSYASRMKAMGRVPKERKAGP